MIVNANVPIDGKLPLDWSVYHAYHMKFMDGVIWADDQTNQYCVRRVLDNKLVESLYASAKIFIMPPIKLIIINPVIDNHLFYDSYRIMMLMKK